MSDSDGQSIRREASRERERHYQFLLDRLEKSEEKYRTLVDHTPWPVFIVQDKRVRFANWSLVEMTGYSLEELIDSEFIRYIDQEERGKVAEYHQNRVLGKPAPEFYRTRVRLKSGDLIWVDVTVKPFTYLEKPAQLVFMYNIDARVRAEEGLRVREEEYRLLVENQSDLLVKVDANGLFEFVSPSYCELFGKSWDELIGKSFVPLVHEDDRESTMEAMEALYKPPWRADIEQRAMTSKGWRWLEWADTAILDEAGKVTGIVGVGRDITEKKEAEARLRLLSKAVEHSPVSVMITDPEGVIEYVNPVFTEITGYSLEETLGNKPSILKSGLHPVSVYKELWDTIKAGKEWNRDLQNKTKDGEIIWEKVFIAPIFNDARRITHFVSIQEDVTQVKKLWNDLLASKQKAEESGRLKSAFLATINHELRTPLNHILGFSDLLVHTAPEGGTAEYAKIIHNSGKELLQIIEDIFELALSERREIKLRKERFSLANLYADMKAGLQDILEKAGKGESIRLAFSPETALLARSIHCDRNKLSQVLVNLFRNAVKYTDSGLIEFGLRSIENGRIAFTVRDTGIGIPESKQDIIFEFFRQGDDSHTRRYGGVGIGLAISRKIALAMGGEIHVDSEPGRGSTFTFVIPADFETSKTQNTRPMNRVEVPDLAGKSILVVEDDPDSLLILNRLIDRTGANVINAENGFEAIQAIDSGKPIHVVLMDLKMPVMDGFEATVLIRKRNPELPVVALTAYSLSEDRQKAMEAGCLDFLTKPVDKALLYRKLETFSSSG